MEQGIGIVRERVDLAWAVFGYCRCAASWGYQYVAEVL